MAVHPFEGPVASALQGEVELRAELAAGSELVQHLIGHDVAFQGAEPYADHTFRLSSGDHSVTEIVTGICSVSRKVDSSKDYLMVSFFGK